MQFDFTGIPQPWGTILPILMAGVLMFGVKAATDWLRSRARSEIDRAARDVAAASARLQKALANADPADDAEARRLYGIARIRAQAARDAAARYEAIAKGLESLPIPGAKPGPRE